MFVSTKNFYDKGYAVIDLETTGLTNTDTIVEFGIVLMNSEGQITDIKETLIRPETSMKASEIHGITDDMVRHAPTMGVIGEQILCLLEGRKLVAHNSSFEARFLSRAFHDFSVLINEMNFIDTLKVSRSHLKLPNHKLATIATHYGVTIDNPHHAVSDALATALVLQNMFIEPSIPTQIFDAVPLYVSNFDENIFDETMWLPRSLA